MTSRFEGGSHLLLWWLLAAYNTLVFGAYGLDKLRAKRGWRRTPEATLLWLAAALGAPGAWLAMQLFRHKTQKPRFSRGVPALLILQAAGWFWGESRGYW